jgi:hypothetical protein
MASSLELYLQQHGYTPDSLSETQHVYKSPTGETLTVHEGVSWTLTSGESGAHIPDLMKHLEKV